MSTIRSESMKLYGPVSAAIATIMGSLMGGVLLLWLNYQAMGRPDLARKMGWIGFAIQVVLLLVFSSLPQNQIVMLGLPLTQVAVAYFGMHFLQGSAIQWHLQSGASLQSPWRAAGLGLAVGLVMFFAAVALFTVLASTGVISLPQGAATPAA